MMSFKHHVNDKQNLRHLDSDVLQVTFGAGY
jgi:hypothetical protein